jgi:S-adenosylmethionine-diacylgycerolhomoserine-N-methlytransferase
MNHEQMMDRIYRYQRHVYDVTRRFVLPGRDTLIQKMEVYEQDRVLEIACGTARNLIVLAKLYPNIKLYGIDASKEMLKTAKIKIHRAKLSSRIELKHCLAEDIDHSLIFRLNEPFELIFFSYSLSMITDNTHALDVALKNLKTGRTIYIVDFWDQRDFPLWLRKIFKQWLSLFHVEYKIGAIDYLNKLDRCNLGEFKFHPIYKGYSFISTFRKYKSQNQN